MKIVLPIATRALPGARVPHADFDRMAMAISDAVRAGCDALLRDLHGAMITTMCDDGDGELLMRVREAAPDLPIAVALEFHANVTARMVENALRGALLRSSPGGRRGAAGLDRHAAKRRLAMTMQGAPLFHAQRVGLAGGGLTSFARRPVHRRWLTWSPRRAKPRQDGLWR